MTISGAHNGAQPLASKYMLHLAAVWLLLIVICLAGLQYYDRLPGAGAKAPPHWPTQSSLARSATRSTLIMLLHSKCFCSHASLEELNRVLTKAAGTVTPIILFTVPEGEVQDLEQSRLWQSAKAIREVHLVKDLDGKESALFGAYTSGQVLLYNADSALVFAGGITSGRGHPGDNESSMGLEHAINAPKPQNKTFPVFGCELVLPW